MWLQRSFVGKLRDVEKIKQVGESFFSEGFKTIKVRFLGDNLVLLTGEEGVNLETTLQRMEAWKDELFVEVIP